MANGSKKENPNEIEVFRDCIVPVLYVLLKLIRGMVKGERRLYRFLLVPRQFNSRNFQIKSPWDYRKTVVFICAFNLFVKTIDISFI